MNEFATYHIFFQVLYIYESIAGYGLIVLRTIGWCMFIYSTFFTLKHYPDKGGFYYPYFSFYTLWFVAGPCIIIIANHIIAEWVRQKVSQAVYFFAIFLPCTQICFCALQLDFMQHPIQGRRKVLKSRPLDWDLQKENSFLNSLPNMRCDDLLNSSWFRRSCN